MSTPNLLLHFDSDFSDATGGHFPSATSTVISTAQYKFGGASALFSSGGSGSYVNVSDNLADFTWSGDFTIDMWFWPIDFINGCNLYNLGNDNLHIYVTAGTNTLLIYSLGTPITGTTALSTGTWYHVALTRSGSTARLFLNGVQEGSSWTTSQTFTPTSMIWIGRNYSPSGQYTNGYIDEFRIVNGTADWTANFTPPTGPYSLPGPAYNIVPQTFGVASALGVGQIRQTFSAIAGLAGTSNLLASSPAPVVGIVKSIGPQLLSGGAGLSVVPLTQINLHPLLAGRSAMRAKAYPAQFGAAQLAGASSLLVVDNSTWPNVIHTAHYNDIIEEDVRTNVNDGQCLVVDGPSLVGRVTTGYGPAQRILFGGTLHLTGYTLADDQSALNTNVATLQGQVATLQGTEAADASNIATLQGQNATLQSQVATLQGQVIALQQQVSILSATSKVGPLQGTIAGTSAMLVRPGALMQAGAAITATSALSGDIGHQVLLAATLAPQPGLTASAGLNANISVRFTPGFYMTVVAGGPGFAQPAPMQVASALTVGFQLFAQPALMASAAGLTAAASNLLTMLPGLMQFNAGLSANATSSKILAPQILPAAGGLLPINLTLLGSAPATLAAAGILAVGETQLSLAAAAFAPAGALAAAATQPMSVSALLPGAGTMATNAGRFVPGAARFALTPALLANATQVLGISNLDPANKSSNVTLSNANMTATAAGSSVPGGVRGTRSRNSGKYYFEVTVNVATILTNAQSAGIGNSSYALGSVGSDANSYGLALSGSTWASQNSSIANYSSTLSPIAGQILMIAVDLTGGNVYFGINGTWTVSASSTFPSAADFSFTGGTTMWPAIAVATVSGTNMQMTFNPGSSAFAFGPPSGYSAWG